MPLKENRYINREISWLQFNARVLQEAEDPSVPLLERLRFIGIFSNNLDEFFKVRYSRVQQIAMAGKQGKSMLQGYEASELLELITSIVIRQQSRSFKVINSIFKEFKAHNIHVIREDEVNSFQADFLSTYFVEKISPILMVYMLDNIDSFPHLKDSAVYLAVKLVLDSNKKRSENIQEKDKKIYALIEIPVSIDRFVVLPIGADGKQYVMFLDDVIRYNMDTLFNILNYSSVSAHMIKITRDAQLDIDSDFKKSFIDKISKSVQNRKKGNPVRFVYDKNIDTDTLKFLLQKMNIQESDSIIPGGRYHNRKDYMKFPSLGHDELTFNAMKPLSIKGLDLKGSILEKIAQKDYLLHTPYQSFSYVVKFLREVAIDPKVISIKITIYRLSKMSHIISALVNAAKNGKEVTVQIELQARFDEANNIMFAKKLQREGVRVVFGVPGLKVHCKTCLIERLEQKKIVRYGFISTGNFNESTAKIYTDFTLFTSHAGILKDLHKVFNFFDINYKVPTYKHLLVSPHYNRPKINELINQEIKKAKDGEPARIRIKVNSLSDLNLIDRLYKASETGVKVDLIIRGICCLIPGVKGMSENIRVISVVDRFLEHPRLYIFGTDKNPKIYISSADWMVRNMDRRVEVSCPIYDTEIQNEILDTFEICWKDNVKAREITNDQSNTYVKNTKETPKIRSQQMLYTYYNDQLKQ